VHVITGLNAGGAEAMLVKLAERHDRDRFSMQVVSLLEGGVNADRLRSLGVPVHSLGMTAGLPDPRALLALTRWLRRTQPEIVQTWMYHGDVLGGLAARAAGVPAVVWNVQNSCLPPEPSWSTWAAMRMSTTLARELPDRVVVCSESGARWHAAQGYPVEKMTLIENGIDLVRFRPDDQARQALRKELRLAPGGLTIGVPARFAPEKDHATFLAAIRLLRDEGRDVTAVLCGIGTEADNPEVATLVARHGLSANVRLLGPRNDMPRLLPAFDVACLTSSHVEAFSNALGEAMACAVPCVATDVGDNRRLLGDDAVIVPAKDPALFARALARLLDEGEPARRQRGAALRKRAQSLFSLERTVARYQKLYASLPSLGPSS
jgi:glycosyltransferase involved in cell wall biosynthesis